MLDPELLSGTITDIAGEDTIELSQEFRVRLWGLKISDVDRVKLAVIGKDVDCFVLFSSEDIPIVDCLIIGMGSSYTQEELYLNLLEMKGAEAICGEEYLNREFFIHKIERTYTCLESGASRKGNIIFTPTLY